MCVGNRFWGQLTVDPELSKFVSSEVQGQYQEIQGANGSKDHNVALNDATAQIRLLLNITNFFQIYKKIFYNNTGNSK